MVFLRVTHAGVQESKSLLQEVVEWGRYHMVLLDLAWPIQGTSKRLPPDVNQGLASLPTAAVAGLVRG